VSPSASFRILRLSFLTGLAGAIMPGPLLVATIEQTILQGFRAVIGLMCGHAILEAVIILLLYYGMREFLARPRVRGLIGLIGGAALLFFGMEMLRGASSLTLDLAHAGHATYNFPMLILMGVAISAMNPYFTGWWVTVGLGQSAHLQLRTPGEYLSFYVGHEASDFAWYALIATFIVTGRQWLTNGMYQGLVIFCGALLVLLALLFIFLGTRLLRVKPK
jgi:threonine/homoserine/homoserine lactone efflux protein